MRNYRILTALISPLIPLWLFWRKLRGKEDAQRIKERFGHASHLRPKGTLIWLHAASVGEANSVLPLIEQLRAGFPDIHLLLTTGTVTSAKLMQSRLPKGVLHQYAPVDTPQATARFIRHWRPDFAFWVESEFWPNLIAAARAAQCFMGVINARMSARSFAKWQKHPAMIKDMLASFTLIFAQSDDDASRLKLLGAANIASVGNIKYDAALLPCDEAELVRLKRDIGDRPLWLAASTHPGEEAGLAQIHQLLRVSEPELLLILVPRHPERGAEIAKLISAAGDIALRSAGHPITAATAIYIADTLGELGLFYRLSEIVFMGGSLVPHGGQNPLEPARLACAILAGPHTHNFADMYQDMTNHRCCIKVENGQTLAADLNALIHDTAMLDTMQQNAKQWIASKGGATGRTLAILSPILAIRGKR